MRSDARSEDGERIVEIKMTLTAPGCGMGEILVQDVKDKVEIIPTVGEPTSSWCSTRLEPEHDVRRCAPADRHDVGPKPAVCPGIPLRPWPPSLPATTRRSISMACWSQCSTSAANFYAIDDICTHDGGELAGGAVEGDVVICPRHGARFCLRTGAALTPPAYEPVRTYPTRVVDGKVEIQAPD